MTRKRERRSRGRPRSRAKARSKARKKGTGTAAKKKARARASKRAETFEKQAAHGIKLDDLGHGETELPLHLLAKGKVLKRYLQCGKENCMCNKGGKKHGPYYYLVINIPANMRGPGDPKQKWFYLTKEEAERFKARIRNFSQLVNNMFSDIWEELNTK